MVFSGVTFLFYFLPAVLLLYAVAPRAWRNAVLLLASVFFYIWGAGVLVIALLISVVVDYGLGFGAARAATEQNRRLKHLVIGASVAVNIGLLAWFKYATWLIESVADVGLYTGAIPVVVLPIGISFFTFQSMSYTIDVARGRSRHLVNPIDFALYVTLFPQLIAGPIVRYHEIEQQIRSRTFSLGQVGDGAIRFSHGLAKKVIVADTVAPLADSAFATASTAPDSLTTGAAWVGSLAYAVQIYFDFSGYSDMAIGLGTMFGFTIPENFRRPYSALSVTDFWRRWHITLSNWFRDYLYIPLGGSRDLTNLLVFRNLFAVFLLTGLWHGANWTFVLWGVYHGAWLLAERQFGWRQLDGISLGRDAIRRATTFLIVVLGWVLFRADSVGTAVDYYRAMIPGNGLSLDAFDPILTSRTAITFLFALIIVVLLPRWLVIGRALLRPTMPAFAGRSVVMLVALPSALLLVAAGAFSPFLYFQF